MMTKLREFSKLFIIIVAASFIGLMVFEWGMDYTGKSRTQNVVGSVNGHKLTYPMFTELYQQLYENQRARTGDTNFDENQLRQLRDQVWDQFIQRTLFKEEMEKLGITVSDSEIVYQIYNYPLEDFKQHPAFQTDGIFDMSKYKAALGDPNIPWLQVEEIYRQQIPFVKLQNIITNTVRVSDEEALDAYKKQNIKAKVEYLGINASSFNTPDIQVTESEIKDFYNDHKEDYKQNEKRELTYVLFPIKTTHSDTAHVLSEFETIKKRLADGEEFKDLALEYSMDPSVQSNNGDLGYFDRNAMVKPFADAAFNAKIGDLVGPVETQYGLHLIKVEDKRTEDGKEEVKASHILLKVTPAPSTMEEQENKARFFSEDAKDTGFDKMVEKDSLKTATTGLFEERSGYIPGPVGVNPAVMNFAFASKLNEVSSVYKLDESYAVFKLTEIQPEGYQSLESVKPLVENRVKLEKAKAKAKTFAESIQNEVTSGEDFKRIADSDTSKNIRYNETGLFTINGNVPGVGKVVEFNAEAFSLNKGERSGLVETDRGYYYLHLLDKTAFDSTAFNQQKASLSRQLLNQKKNQIFADWYTSLKQKADIEDNRKLFNL